MHQSNTILENTNDRLVEIDQLIYLRDYQNSRISDKTLEMWCSDMKKQKILFDDFQFFSNVFKKQNKGCFHPSDVIIFLTSTNRLKKAERRAMACFYNQCDGSGFVYIQNNEHPIGIAYRCKCNSDKLAQHLKEYVPEVKKEDNPTWMTSFLEKSLKED